MLPVSALAGPCPARHVPACIRVTRPTGRKSGISPRLTIRDTFCFSSCSPDRFHHIQSNPAEPEKNRFFCNKLQQNSVSPAKVDINGRSRARCRSAPPSRLASAGPHFFHALFQRTFHQRHPRFQQRKRTACAIAQKTAAFTDTCQEETLCRQSVDHSIPSVATTDENALKKHLIALNETLSGFGHTIGHVQLSSSCGTYLLRKGDTRTAPYRVPDFAGRFRYGVFVHQSVVPDPSGH